MKVKPHHYRDFKAYVDFNLRINKSHKSPRYFCPAPFPVLEKGDVDVVRFFTEIDTHGRTIGLPDEPVFLKLAIDGKRLLNWHIEQWAEGMADGTLMAWEIREHLFALPDWVCDSLERQVYKLMKA